MEVAFLVAWDQEAVLTASLAAKEEDSKRALIEEGGPRGQPRQEEEDGYIDFMRFEELSWEDVRKSLRLLLL